MAEVAISVAAKLAEYLVEPIIREAKYLFCVYKIKRDLENAKEEMIQKQERVQKRIEEELRRANVIVDAVNDWKKEVQSLITEVEKLEEDLSTNSGCVRGWCPNWKRYRICKQMAEKIEAMKPLTEKSEFDPFSHPAPLPDIDYFSSENRGNAALDDLRSSKPLYVEEGERDAFTCLQLSYNHLTSQEAKSLFLMCAMFPEDDTILVEDLFKYAVGRGLLGEVKSFDIARSKLNTMIDNLVESCLLTRLETNHLRMHDMVRDLALWIASKGELLLMCAMFPEDDTIFVEDLFKYAVGRGLLGEVKSFDIARSTLNTMIDNLVESCLLTRLETNHLKMHDMVRDLALWIASKGKRIINDSNSLADEEAIKNCKTVSLRSNITEFMNLFPHKMDAPMLEILLLDIRSSWPNFHWDLSRYSFHMNALKVLSMRWGGFPVSFPQSFQWLANLRTLRLVWMKLGEISFVASLARLQILDLSRSAFKELPNGIENLQKLMLLDLTGCLIENSCDEVLARCSKLEELYADTLSQIISYECFSEDACLLKLQRYRIKVGWRKFYREFWSSSRSFNEPWASSSRSVIFEKLDMSTSSAIVKNLLQRAYVICLKSLKGGCNSIIPELVQPVGGVIQNELETLALFSCLEIKCLFNTNPGECNLCNLRELRIVDCPKLTSLFPIFAAQTMLHLEMLYIENCGKLKCIILNEEGVSDTGEEILPASRNEDPHNLLEPCFPSLTYIDVRRCNKLKKIFSITTAGRLPQLRSMCISELAQLKEVFKHTSKVGAHNEKKVMFPELEVLRLENLPNLIRISRGFQLRAVKLRKVVITECPRLWPQISKVIWNWKMEAVKKLDMQLCDEVSNDVIEEEKMVVISRVKWLYLKHSLLMSLWNGPTSISFQNLQLLRVAGCSKLKCIFSVAVIRSVPQLMGLKIEGCDELEGIISDAENDQQWPLPNPSSSHPPQFKFCFPKLRALVVIKCSKLKCVLSVFDTAAQLPRLGQLEIKGCCELEHVLVCASDMVEREGRDGEMMQIVLPKLEHLELKGLPILTDICTGFHSHLQLPALRSYEVKGCSKLSSTTIAALEQFMNTGKKEEEEEFEEELKSFRTGMCYDSCFFCEDDDYYVSEGDDDDSVEDE